MTCESCGDKPKKCNKDFTKAVIEIDNPEQITLMRKVVIPTSMGDDTAVPPVVGKYHNVLLYYEANQKSYLYSSDGIPTQLVNGVTDYEAAINLPQINGNTLIGNKTGEELGLQDKLTAGDNITIENNVISATDTTYGPATDTEIGMVKPGDGLEVASDGNISVKAGAGITVDENGVSETPYNDYIEDIEVHRIKYEYASNDTISYIDYAIIPATYKPSIIMSDPTNPNTRKVASDFDYEHKPTLMCNFGPWNVNNDVTYGPLIIDGDIKVENNLTSGNTEWEQNVMGIDSDGRLVNIYGGTTASAITVPNAIRSWGRLYEDGVSNPEVDPAQHNPHTWIAQDYDGNYLIAVCGGRDKHDTGMTADDQIRFVTTTVSFNARIIFNADGGGSSNLLYHGIRQNDLISGEDRACPNWLVWTSPTAKHEAVFKNQSVNNAHNVYEFKRERRLSDGYQYNADYIGTNFITAPAEVRSQSRITFPTPFTVIYNLEFYVNGEVGTTVAANTILLDNLPWTSGNYYVMGLNRSDDTPVQFVLRQETGADGHRYSTLRNVSAIPVRKNYTFNQTFWTAYRQFDE